jgi:predicted metal-binding membrane protein
MPMQRKIAPFCAKCEERRKKESIPPRGFFQMGLEHGAYCVGCCWALMLLLFAGGVMNLAVIAALTVFVVFEKLAPLGDNGARASGVLLLAAGVWVLVM